MDKTDALEKSIRAIADKASLGMQSLLSKSLSRPIDSNGIIGHTDLKITRTGSVITIETQFPSYAHFVQNGRKPGKMPPDKPIRDWVKKHNINEDAVFPIRRKIGKEGTKPKPFIEPLRRMIEMVTKTCLQWSANFVKEDILNDLNNLPDIEVTV